MSSYPLHPKKRVLVYSHDTFGLGNIRRMLEIARHLVQASPEVQVLVITGSPMLHAFQIPERVDYIKLPCLARNVEGRYAARSLHLTLAETVRLRANLIRCALQDFRPDLVLVDKKPFGVEDELAGALSVLTEAGQRPRMALLLRDILDAPQSTAPVWRKNGYFDAIGAYYDRVLVVGSPEVFDLVHEYEFPPLAAAKVDYCGYIAREPGRRSRRDMRQQLGVNPDEPLVLVTPGGGEDGLMLIRAALQGLRTCAQGQRPRTHIVCGPELAEPARADILAEVRGIAGVTAQAFSDDMMSLQAAADVVLCMGGYNTVCELLSCGRRAVLVPRTQPGTEQLIRAERMHGLGLVEMIHPAQLTPEALMAGLRRQLAACASGAAAPRLPDRHGLERVTAGVFELIGLPPSARRAPAPAQRPLRTWARGAAPNPAGVRVAP